MRDNGARRLRRLVMLEGGDRLTSRPRITSVSDASEKRRGRQRFSEASLTEIGTRDAPSPLSRRHVHPPRGRVHHAGHARRKIRCRNRHAARAARQHIGLARRVLRHRRRCQRRRAAASEAQANAWHATGLANGGTAIEDPPGQRQNGLYLAYLRDPDGNKICALHRPG